MKLTYKDSVKNNCPGLLDIVLTSVIIDVNTVPTYYIMEVQDNPMVATVKKDLCKLLI